MKAQEPKPQRLRPKAVDPTRFQATLLGRALAATRYTEQRRALWRAVYKQAAATVRHYHLSRTGEELVAHWLDLQPEDEERNSIAVDDILVGFKTIAQEAGAVVVPLDSLEEFGDTWQEAPEDSTEARLSDALEWRDGVHPVTDQCHLPRWCDNNVDADPDAHLEPAFLGFQGHIGNTDAPPWPVWQRIVKARKKRSLARA